MEGLFSINLDKFQNNLLFVVSNFLSQIIIEKKTQSILLFEYMEETFENKIKL